MVSCGCTHSCLVLASFWVALGLEKSMGDGVGFLHLYANELFAGRAGDPMPREAGGPRKTDGRGSWA